MKFGNLWLSKKVPFYQSCWFTGAEWLTEFCYYPFRGLSVSSPISSSVLELHNLCLLFSRGQPGSTLSILLDFSKNELLILLIFFSLLFLQSAIATESCCSVHPWGNEGGNSPLGRRGGKFTLGETRGEKHLQNSLWLRAVIQVFTSVLNLPGSAYFSETSRSFLYSVQSFQW